VTKPRRTPARSKKGAGQAAAAERGPAGAQSKHARAVSKADARKKHRAEAPSPAPQTGMQLQTADGIRKYLTAGERAAFLCEADQADRPVRTLCMTLAYAGCRLSEALALTADRVDLAAGVPVFESLKKRRIGIFGSVPVPLPCSIPSTWCTAFANCTQGAAKGAACRSGHGRG
jgi:integrase